MPVRVDGEVCSRDRGREDSVPVRGQHHTHSCFVAWPKLSERDRLLVTIDVYKSDKPNKDTDCMDHLHLDNS